MIRLHDAVFINDTLIDFYCSYLLSKPDSFGESLKPSQVHVFSPLLVQAIANASDRTVPDYRAIVEKWTKGLDVFTKKFVFFPINSCLHWSLVVLCNPDRFTSTRQPGCRPKSAKQPQDRAPQLHALPRPRPRQPPSTATAKTITALDEPDVRQGLTRSQMRGQEVGAQVTPSQNEDLLSENIPHELGSEFVRKISTEENGINGSSYGNDHVDGRRSFSATNDVDANSHADAHGGNDSTDLKSTVTGASAAEDMRKACGHAPRSPHPEAGCCRSSPINVTDECESFEEAQVDEYRSAGETSDGYDTELEHDALEHCDFDSHQGSYRDGSQQQQSNSHKLYRGQKSVCVENDEEGAIDMEEDRKSTGNLLGGGRKRRRTLPTTSRPRRRDFSAQFSVVGSRDAGACSTSGERDGKSSRIIDSVTVDDSPPHSTFSDDEKNVEEIEESPAGDPSGTRIRQPQDRHGDERGAVTDKCARLPYRASDAQAVPTLAGRPSRSCKNRRASRLDPRSYERGAVDVSVPVCSLQGLPPSRLGPVKHSIHQTCRSSHASVDGETIAGRVDLKASPSETSSSSSDSNMGTKSMMATSSLKASLERSLDGAYPISTDKSPNRSTDQAAEGFNGGSWRHGKAAHRCIAKAINESAAISSLATTPIVSESATPRHKIDRSRPRSIERLKRMCVSSGVGTKVASERAKGYSSDGQIAQDTVVRLDDNERAQVTDSMVAMDNASDGHNICKVQPRFGGRSESPMASSHQSEPLDASHNQLEAVKPERDEEFEVTSSATPSVTKRYSMRERPARGAVDPVHASHRTAETMQESSEKGDGWELGAEEEIPCMLMLDSTKGHRSQDHFKTVRKYVEAAWNTARGESWGEANVCAKTLPGCSPQVPQQSNDCDCGVYVIHFVKRILKTPPAVTKEFFARVGRGSIFGKRWFDADSIKQQRRDIRNTVETLRWEAIQRQRIKSK